MRGRVDMGGGSIAVVGEVIRIVFIIISFPGWNTAYNDTSQSVRYSTSILQSFFVLVQRQ